MTDPAVLIRQLQGYLRWFNGDPNGNVDAPKGAHCLDTSGATKGYYKSTDLGTLTGWLAI